MLNHFLNILYDESIKTLIDLAPIVALVAVFLFGAKRRPVARLSRILVGLVYVAIGLTLFRIGIQESLIPIARDLARHMVASAYDGGAAAFGDYLPILAFAALIGFAAALLEPTLIAAADRVEDLSGGALRAWRLRLAVACGVALGLLVGTLRILYEGPLSWLLAGQVLVLIVLALTAPRGAVPLALDSGGIATSVVTVPLIAAYGAAVAESMPGATTAAEGFGLIVMALFWPVLVLLALARIRARRLGRAGKGEDDAIQADSRPHGR